jgi:hypothetical protein
MKKTRTTFYCFSPPVMIATFVIESVLFVYTLIRYRMNTAGRLAAALLASLAIFQLAEYHVCRYSGTWSAAVGSRVGYAAITLLPPLALHLIRTISGRGWRGIVWLAYVSAVFFAIFFGFSKTAFASHVCAGNYAIFQLADRAGGVYFAYYYFWLLVGIGMALYFAMKGAQKTREALLLQVFGYLVFLLPTGIVNAINPKTIAGIPSIMCGFAVIYALILVFGIVPRALSRRG